jgi:hypothetical protein
MRAGAGTRGERGVQMYERARICKFGCHAPAFRTSLRMASKRGVCFVGIDSEWDGHSEPIPSRIHPRFEATHLTFIA